MNNFGHPWRTEIITVLRPIRTGAVAFVAALGIGFSASMEEVHAETLRGALAKAYNFSPTLKAQRAALRGEDEKVPLARSGFRPTITSSYTGTYTDQKTRPASSTDGSNWSDSFRINFSQPVFRGFRTINAIREADALVYAGREDLRQTEQTVLLDAVTAYMNVVRDQAIVRHRERNVENLARQLQASKDRLAVGEATRTDVAQSKARLALGRSQLSAARGNLRASKAAYIQVIGTSPRSLRRPGDLSHLLPPNLNAALAAGRRDNPEILAAIFREKAARHALDKINGEFLPEVSVQAEYQKLRDPSPLVQEQDVLTVTGQVSIPLYQAGAVSARSRQGMHIASQRQREVDAARERVKAAIISAWAQRQAALAQVRSDRLQVEANRVALAGVREELKEGQRSVLDVLNTETDLINSLVALENSRRDLVVSTFRLLSAVGRLSAADLGLSVALYDPSAHYNEVRRKWWGPGRYGQDPYDD